MKIGIMQPYFMPYIGYISLIKQTDQFILLDSVQFMRHGWIERNRILKPDLGWQYIQVPLIKRTRFDKINEININNSLDWKNRILAQIQHYKKTAPYYFKVLELLKEVLNHEYSDIVSLNMATLKAICNYLGIKKDISIFSTMNLEIEEVKAADEWALNICRALGNVDEYWNPPGGISFFDTNKYYDVGIKPVFHCVNIVEYNQKREVFEPGLSILDVMMFNSIEDITLMLDNYNIINDDSRV